MIFRTDFVDPAREGLLGLTNVPRSAPKRPVPCSGVGRMGVFCVFMGEKAPMRCAFTRVDGELRPCRLQG